MNIRTLYRLRISLCLAMVLAAPAVADADVFQSHESIRTATRSFLDQRVNRSIEAVRYRIDVDRLDLHLRLPLCHSELQGFLPLGGRLHGRTTVGIRCPGDDGWTIYVPARVKPFPHGRIG